MHVRSEFDQDRSLFINSAIKSATNVAVLVEILIMVVKAIREAQASAQSKTGRYLFPTMTTFGSFRRRTRDNRSIRLNIAGKTTRLWTRLRPMHKHIIRTKT